MASLISKIVPALRGASNRALSFPGSLPGRSSAIHTSSVVRAIFKVQNPEEFDEKVLKSKTPVVVDFYATWCGPCKMLTPRIESVVTEVKGVTLAKVDIDEHNDLAFDFDVSSVPVLVGMKDGKEVARMVGLQDTDKLKKFVEIIAASK